MTVALNEEGAAGLPTDDAMSLNTSMVGGDETQAADWRWITPLQQFTLGWDIFPMLGGRKGAYAHHILGDPALEIGPPPKREHDLTAPTNWVSGWSRLTIEQVRAYWPGDGRHNIGVATGRRSGVWVLDVDVILDTEAEAREYVAEMTGIEIPQTLSVRTASGKWHFYFKMPESPDIYIKSSVGKLAPNVDVRGDGGMAMGICSAVTDADGQTTYYEVATMAAPAYAPLALLDRVKAKDADIIDAPVASVEKRVDVKASQIAETHMIEPELQKLRDLPRPWHEGAQWHNTCFEVACQVLEFANSEWCALTPEEAQRRYFETAPGPEKGWNPAKEWDEGVKKTAGRARPLPKVSDAADAAAAALMASAPARPSAPAQAPDAPVGIAPPSYWPVQPSTNWAGTSRSLARRIVREFVPSRDKTPLLAIVQDQWHYWTGSHWQHIPNTEISDFVSNVLTLATEPPEKNGSDEPEKPKAASTSGRVVNDLVQSGLAPELRLHVEPGQRIGGSGDERMIGLANGVLAVQVNGDHTFTAPSPLFFNRTAGTYDYDPAATCPQWEAWLRETFDHDPQAVPALQEWFGAFLLADPARVQKIFWLLGPRRSGKGTIQGVAANLVGGAAPTTLRSFASQFGRENLVGHSLAIIDDSRDPRREEVDQVVEFLLTYSTGGAVTIPRKNRTSWDGVLRQSLLAASNNPPRLADDGNAMASRMEVIQTRKSAYGHEDRFLPDRLKTELPGILNWALAGLERLVANDFRFTQAEAADRVRTDVQSSGTGAGAFVEDSIMAGGHVTNADIRLAAEVWTREQSESGNPPHARAIKAAIQTAFPDAKNEQRIPALDGSRPKGWHGVTLCCARCSEPTIATTVSRTYGPLCPDHLGALRVAGDFFAGVAS